MNDITSSVRICKVILYADDTVIFTSNKSCKQIENDLNNDLKAVSQWLDDNNLVINLKKGKTELVLYGTSRKLALGNAIQCYIKGTQIYQTQCYKYLGVSLDNKLNLVEHHSNIYKKLSSRIKLLKRIRHKISPHTAALIYQMMIEPIMFYCNNVFVNITDTQAKKYQYIQNRAKVIINYPYITDCWRTIKTLRLQKCAVEVFKNIHGIAPELRISFGKISHQQNTRGNNKKLKLPKVKTECGRKTFKFVGSLVFNKLPPNIADEISFAIFKRKVRDFDF